MKKTYRANQTIAKPSLKTAENTAKAIAYFDQLARARKALSLPYKGKELLFNEDSYSSSGLKLQYSSMDTVHEVLEQQLRNKHGLVPNTEKFTTSYEKLLSTSPLSDDFNWAEKFLNKAMPGMALQELADLAKSCLSSVLNCQIELTLDMYDYTTAEYKITLGPVVMNKHLPFIWQQKRLNTSAVCTGLTIGLDTTKHEFYVVPELTNFVGENRFKTRLTSAAQLKDGCATFENILKYVFFTQSNEPSISHVYCTPLAWLSFLDKDFQHKIAQENRVNMCTIWSDAKAKNVLSWKEEFEKHRNSYEELYSK